MSGKLTLISSATASDSASVEFTSGIDSTYDEYVFYFVDVNPATDAESFAFQVNASGQTGFNETMTTTTFRATHREADTAEVLEYDISKDQAQGTGYQLLSYYIGNAADECVVGELHLFNPASTTYVKHFYARTNCTLGGPNPQSQDYFTAGYINTTSAIDEIAFKMGSGNFDGQIHCFGVS